MPRKDLLHDLARCQQTSFPNIADVRQGPESNLVAFTYMSESLPEGYVNIQVLIPETFDYPSQHQYILFVENHENVPSYITGVMEQIQAKVDGKNLSAMIAEVSDILTYYLSGGTRSNPIRLNDDGEDFEDPESAEAKAYESEPFEEFDAGENELDDDDLFFPEAKVPAAPSALGLRQRKSRYRTVDHSRVKCDLQEAKKAGFKIGILGDLSTGGIVCVSIRVAKLGISEEAMSAWGLKRQQYLVLMIKFQAGYKTLEQVCEMNSLNEQTDMRVALCKHYKPDSTHAFKAFAAAKRGDEQDNANQVAAISLQKTGDTSRSDALEPLFISGPLNSLLRERFPVIVRARLACAVPWMGAEMFYNDNQGITHQSKAMDKKYYTVEQRLPRALKPIVEADTIAQGVRDLSLPLVAMQFLLRHFVRSTEFCLVCHCKTTDTFEALKPYVCSKPLCLYQYINLGFGPSIEWEILTQPYVVDLLISFCYVSACYGRLKTFPVGLGLNVPLLQQSSSLVSTPTFEAAYGQSRQELLFDVNTNSACPVKVGNYLVLAEHEVWIHARVDETRFYPCVKLGAWSHVPRRNSEASTHPWSSHGDGSEPSSAPAPSLGSFVPGTKVKMHLYNHAFDEMPDDDKRQSISLILDTLPSVVDLRTTLLSGGQGSHPTLKGRILEPALTLLRWIIASNRSCILQINTTIPKHLGNGVRPEPSLAGSAEDRVGGMNGWIQFRFAQGAPDKEQRFVDSVKNVCDGAKYPTLFAWHGSPLSNWHGIIREGLHFNDTLHGRAFGHGVYMSPHAQTSLGYSSMAQYGYQTSTGPCGWPNSVLKISQVLSLQEVVNKPDQFRSRSPHYVVSDTNWIQTRYLFVKGRGTEEIASSGDQNAPARVYEQDPAVCVSNPSNHALKIPIMAVSKSRRPALTTNLNPQTGIKKSKNVTITDEQTAEDLEDDANSVVSDESDRAFLEDHFEEDVEMMDYLPNPPQSPSPTLKRSFRDDQTTKSNADALDLPLPALSTPKTDFLPGKLDLSGLKMLQQPKDTSTITTKTLMRALKDALKVQDRTPLHELGWYIDRELVGNMYQWIVELHSFESSLPLAKDMKAAGLTSIVLELRFTNNFPFSPPFVRVVRPRFLPFNSGGGGHVTAGGAICMELLTNNGWLVTSTIESVLLQIRMAMSSSERPARLEMAGRRSHGSGTYSCYGVGEAIDAYKRACLVHGWQVPADFKTLQMQ